MASPVARTAIRQRPVLHLVCNAHLDPVWLWEWEEGAAEAISTFRSAADFCESDKGFVFNHNEAVLYEWVEEYEPALFRRIQKLVKSGRWHIMGGWYLQPDCNLPSGEGFVRQALVGKRYFMEKFGVEPRTAINFDPFGHDRGLVQVFAKTGTDSYLFCRPYGYEYMPKPLPNDLFRWVGYDGSEVLACRPKGHYNSWYGRATEKIQNHLDTHMDEEAPHGIVLWGIGNHGGGPSRIDLDMINDLIEERRDVFDLTHSTPEAYFEHVRRAGTEPPAFEADVRPWAVGCYTSQSEIKSRYRQLENDLFRTEKMAAQASIAGLLAYPKEELDEAQKDLLFSQFHDILPGSSIEPAERASLDRMSHGIDILSRVRARAFFALASGVPKPTVEGRIPVLVYNPHPHPVAAAIACEFQLHDQNLSGTHTNFYVYHGRKKIPAQIETEASNLRIDWRKRIVFRATLPPSSMSRFECRPEVLKKRPVLKSDSSNKSIRIKTKDLVVEIGKRSGTIDHMSFKGVVLTRAGVMKPLLMHDDADPWGMRVRKFDQVEDRFRPMNATESAEFAGVSLHTKRIDAVRIVEDGAVQTVVEALLKCGESAIQARYTIPKQGTQIGVSYRVHWNHKDRMLKLEVPLVKGFDAYHGQAAFGVSDLPTNGDEAVAGRWVAAVDTASRRAFSVINTSTYGSDFKSGAYPRLRLSLLRSSAYAGHPISKVKCIVPQDRYTPRIDQGVRTFEFWIDGGPAARRLASLDHEAMALNERPAALSFFPSGQGEEPGAQVMVDKKSVQVAAFKRAEDGDSWVVRLFNSVGRKTSCRLEVPRLSIDTLLELGPFEARTLRLTNGRVSEVDMLER